MPDPSARYAAADAGLLLLGLEAGAPRFAKLADAPVRGSRSPALLVALDVLRPDQAAILATARSPLDWHVNKWTLRTLRGPHCGRPGWVGTTL